MFLIVHKCSWQNKKYRNIWCDAIENFDILLQSSFVFINTKLVMFSLI